jgi:hypothetical protein
LIPFKLAINVNLKKFNLARIKIFKTKLPIPSIKKITSFSENLTENLVLLLNFQKGRLQ